MSLSNSLGEFFRHPFVEKLGWALLHFVWQGVALAILLCVILAVMRRVTANARYLVACMGLLLMAALPAVTLGFLASKPDTSRSALGVGSDNALELADFTVTVSGQSTVTQSLPLSGTTVVPTNLTQTLPGKDTNAGWMPVVLPALSLAERCESFLQPWLSCMTMVWLVGVVALALRLLLTWTQVQRLQTHGVRPADPDRTRLLVQLATRLGMRQVVRLLESSLIEVPTVIGWLKPVILLPIASVNSLTVSQLEAILAHELAHIRRADYAVNLLQSLIETLLFYHPAVWWISARIRQEREHCCDDLATSTCGDKASYIAALVRMEELRCEPRGVVVAARGGHLLKRVRRLLAPESHDRLSPWWLTGAAALLVVGGLIGLPVLSKSQAEPVVLQETDEKQKQDTAKEKSSKADPGAGSHDDLDKITPSQIADRIEEAWKKYESIEYTARVEETRNTNAFASEGKPILVKGTGSLKFRTDGTRWYADERSFSYRQGTTETYPIQTTSAFDGVTHQVFDGGKLVLGQDASASNRFAAPAFFWQAGISTDWLIGALRRPEAMLVERIKMAETSCLHVRVKWKPDWDTADRSFDIMISPEQGWLPRRVMIERGGEMQAEWVINEVAMMDSGLAYPVEFETKRPESDTTPLRRITIESFRERAEFKREDFIVPPQLGMDIIDHRQGFAWHNDPWWEELSPWMRENLDWPQSVLGPLNDLRSYSEPELAGMEAPALAAGAWLTEPAPLNWDRPERKVTVLHFYGGLLIEPSPRQLKAFDRLYQKYRDGGLEVIGIASHSKTPEMTRQAVREAGLSFPVFIDQQANDAERQAKVTGAEWGASFVSYRLKPYTGTVVIDFTGKILLIDPNTPNLPNGMSHLEAIVRDQLLKANGTSDPPGLRSALVHRTSQLLRGAPANSAELTIAVIDKSPLWLQNAQQAIGASTSDAQKEFLKSHGLTVQGVLQQLNEDQSSIPIAASFRLEDEWKRRAASAAGKGVIRGKIRQNSESELIGCKATLIVEPVFRLLSSNTPGGYLLTFDRSRTRRIESDANGVFTIGSLPKGTYQVTVAAPARPRTMRTVHLVAHESQVELNIDLRGGDTITGKVTDDSGNVIPKATVKAIKRFLSAEGLEARFQTTEHLPQEPATTNASGDFYFESLYEGGYVFEVSAEGFEATTTEPLPAGYSSLRVILKPTATPDQAGVPATRSIFGTVVHQEKPVANARVGLQAWKNTSSGYRNAGPFVATVVTGADGQYVLKVPASLDENMSVAIWVVAEGFQPGRENIFHSVTDACSELQKVTLTQCSGCVVQINDHEGIPVANAKVFVPSQTLPQSIDFEIPQDWRDLVTGTTDAAGMVRLPYVIPEAMKEMHIVVPGQDAEIHLSGNYFLNAKPATEAPHFQWKLPRTGSLEGQIEVTGGTLPEDLMLQISTQSAMTDEPQRLPFTHGVATAKVDAEGRFSVESLAAGLVSIKPFLSADQPLRAEIPKEVKVVAGKTTSITIPVQKGIHVRSQIVASDTGKGLADVRFSVLYGSSAREQNDMNNSIEMTTDKDGRYEAWVPPGRILLRISWRGIDYSDVEWWSDRAAGLGSAFDIPSVEEFEIDPIRFVPTKQLGGKVVDKDGNPLANWTIFGYPEIPGKAADMVMNSFGGTTTDGDGMFQSLFPETVPPVIWKVSHRDWPTPHESKDRKWPAEVISTDPFVLRVDTTPPSPPAPLRNAVNSGDPADDAPVRDGGLIGKWSLHSMTWNGISVPEEQCRQTTMTIDGHHLRIDKYWNIFFSSVDPETRKAEGGFSADTGLECAIRIPSLQSPKEIDLTLNGVGTPEQETELGAEERVGIQSGKFQFQGIYEINGDELKLCWGERFGETGKGRPRDFSAGEQADRTLFVFKRSRISE